MKSKVTLRACGPSTSAIRSIKRNNVEVDDRGYIYAVDYAVDRANTGLHILTLTGPARQVADFSRAIAPTR